MFKFLQHIGDYLQNSVQASQYIIGQGLSVTFDHMNRRPITVQYPFQYPYENSFLHNAS